jgi:nucleotide-binding universal stress UspA family protein
MTVQHILVPTDFSAYADCALEYAITLASTLHARVTLLHVLSTVYWGTGDVPWALPATFLEELEAATQQSLEPLLQRVRAAGLEGKALVAYGSPFAGIIAMAQDHNVDLIVMGSHGRTGLQHMLLGSVAERVVRLAPCPVLVTRGPAPGPAEEVAEHNTRASEESTDHATTL